MSFSAHDTAFMQQALGLAREALYLTSPNPRVGCVLVGADGSVLGSGHTQRAGEAHAEVMALRDAQANGHDVKGATAYVTLEPCSHQGRTGPCCDALAAAGVARVVVALQDPNPLVAGQGTARLRAAGVQVDAGLLADEAHEMNIGFFKRMTHGTPWVRMKVAASLDGQTALENGVSQWITSAPARDDGHAWRARACAVLTGIGTVLEDDPQLDVRAVPTPRQPTLVVMDSQLETPLTAKLFQPQRPVWIYCATDHAERRAVLWRFGAIACALLATHLGVIPPLLATPLESASFLALSSWAPWVLGLSAAFLVSNFALQYGAARLSAHTTAMVMMSEVVFASVSSVALGASVLTWRVALGGGMIVLTALLASHAHTTQEIHE